MIADSIKSGETPTIMILMVDDEDNATAQTGKSLTIRLSKNGGSFTTAGNTVTEVGRGWYKITLTASQTDTLGDLVIEAEATGCAVWRQIRSVKGDAADNFDSEIDVSLTQTTQDDLADTIWRRSLASVSAASGKDAKGRYTPLTALQSLVGVVDTVGGTVTVRDTNGTSTLATWSVTTGEADLIIARG